jgi:hypothetical protein
MKVIVKKAALHLVSAAILLIPVVASAQTQACLIDGEFTIAGQKIRSKDCMQAPASDPVAEFRRACQELANTSAMLGGKAGNVTYMASCPAKHQGICKGFLRSKRDAYYYERTPDNLAKVPASCERTGGRWSLGR